jgi:hypothetical protein
LGWYIGQSLISIMTSTMVSNITPTWHQMLKYSPYNRLIKFQKKCWIPYQSGIKKFTTIIHVHFSPSINPWSSSSIHTQIFAKLVEDMVTFSKGLQVNGHVFLSMCMFLRVGTLFNFQWWYVATTTTKAYVFYKSSHLELWTVKLVIFVLLVLSIHVMCCS